MPKRFDDLIVRISEHDNEAFEQIHNETKNMVFAIIYPLVGDFHLTEDLMQDTYIKMLRSLESYDRSRPFAPWLGQIAKNIAYDYLRKTKREQKALEESVKIRDVSKGQALDIDRILKQLDEEKQQIVFLRIVANLSFKEIAKSVGKPLGTIYSIYKMAMKELKYHLRKEGIS